MRYFSLLLILTLTSQLALAQQSHYCGTSPETPWFDHYMSNRDDYQFEIPEEPIYIPLTVHVLGDDNGNGYFLKSQVFDAICRLNLDFEATNIQFFLEDEINFINNTTWYDHEEYPDGYDMMNSNNIDGTVNCYIVSNPAGNCGYYAPAGDAVALSKSCMSPNDHTWAHELGHFFSLPHTFRGWEGIDYDASVPTSTYRSQNRRGIESLDGSDCNSSGDRFCDTPPDYLSYRWPCDNQGFSIVQQTDLNGETFRSDGTLFMSYASDNCSNRFSDMQVNAMLANINSVRRELLNNETYAGKINDIPQAIAPEDQANLAFDNGILHWSKVENATSYHVRVSRLPNLGGLLIVDTIISDTSLALPVLSLGKTYYWRITAINKFDFCSNASERFSFIAAALTSNSDVDNDLDLNIWPNPLTKQHRNITVSGLSGEMSGFRFKIYSLNGEQVADGGLNNGQIRLQSTLQPGTYTVMIYKDQKRFVKPLIVLE